MHAASDIRLLRSLDALAMSFAMLDHLHGQLHLSCTEILNDQKNLPIALQQCWSFVDSVHRIREIAQGVPGLSSRKLELKDFLDTTVVAEQFRHYIQHLRREIAKKPGNRFPVWGSLSWTDVNDPLLTHTALAGNQAEETTYVGSVYDFVDQRWVSKVTLGVGDLCFNFDVIYEAIIRFKTFVLPWIESMYQPGVHFAVNVPVISARIQLDEKK